MTKKILKDLTVLLVTLAVCWLTYSNIALAGQSDKEAPEKVSISRYCWNINKYLAGGHKIGCSAQSIIYFSARCEIDDIIKMKKYFDFAPEQKKEILKIYRQFRRRYRVNHSELNLAAMDLQSYMMGQDDIDLNELTGKLSRIKQLCSEITFDVLKTDIAMRKVMNPEQRKRVKELLFAPNRLQSKKKFHVVPCGGD